MSTEMTAALISIVAIAIAAYSVWRASKAGTPITGQLVTTKLQESTSTAQELTATALTAAQAAEQLWRTGKIEKSQRLDKAFAYVRKFFPNLDQATIITAIEAGVLVVNTLVNAVPSKSTGVHGSTPPPLDSPPQHGQPIARPPVGRMGL